MLPLRLWLLLLVTVVVLVSQGSDPLL